MSREAALPEEEKKSIATRIETAKRQREAEFEAQVASLNIKQNLLSSKIVDAESFMQQAKSEISRIKTELQTTRQTLTTASTEQKLVAESTINIKIGELNAKVSLLDAKKTEI